MLSLRALSPPSPAPCFARDWAEFQCTGEGPLQRVGWRQRSSTSSLPALPSGGYLCTTVDPKKPHFSRLLCNLLQRQASQRGTPVLMTCQRRSSAAHCTVHTAQHPPSLQSSLRLVTCAFPPLRIPYSCAPTSEHRPQRISVGACSDSLLLV